MHVSVFSDVTAFPILKILYVIRILPIKNIWAASWQNQQNGMCAKRRLRSAWRHLPSLIKVFTIRMKKSCVLSYPLSAQRRLWSDWADAQADLSLRWAHWPHCWFCHEVTHFVHVSCKGVICLFENMTKHDILLDHITGRKTWLSKATSCPSVIYRGE